MFGIRMYLTSAKKKLRFATDKLQIWWPNSPIWWLNSPIAAAKNVNM